MSRFIESPPPAHTVSATLGAIVEDRSTTFRVWAPDHRQVELAVCGAPAPSPDSGAVDAPVIRLVPLRRDEGGYWTGRVHDLGPGTLYKFRLNGQDDQTFPDPASRSQPFGVHGPSAVVDPRAFRWTDDRWSAPPLDRVVIYELHVGTFSADGTFRGVAERLPWLVELGVTAVELMPVADFPGDRNWGYDGVALFAPARCYGTPDDLRALVDAAHAHGLAVFMDAVYNHFGPDGAYANVFSSHYFTDAHESPWGRGVNLDRAHGEAVRRFFVENAVHWVNEYHVDGLRLDATHALIDDSARHFLAELTSTVRAQARRPVHFVAEDHRNLAMLLQLVEAGGYGVDAVWADDFHHQARVHTARDREGYYADFSGSTQDLARTLEQGWFFTGQHSEHGGHARGTDPSALHPRQFVICIQNHDQIGNRADGARVNHEVDPPVFRALSTLLLLAPQTPLIFMGQEWAATAPFLYFTDHHDELGRLVTEGRRQEFKSFAAFADPAARTRIPDPQALETFTRSRLDWSELDHPNHGPVLRLYRRLLALRRSAPALRERPRGSYVARALDEETVAVDYRAGSLVVIARLGGAAGTVDVGAQGAADVVFTSEDADVAPDPRPVVVEPGGSVRIAFERPGAVILARPAGGPGASGTIE